MSEPRTDSSVIVRPATDGDRGEIELIEQAARGLLLAHGVDLQALDVPGGIEDPAAWTLACLAEVDGLVVGIARLTALDRRLLSLDQVSVRPEFARQGVGTALLSAVATQAKELGYAAITGTTFRDIPFNAPFYTHLGGVEDTQPHPAMLKRREVETAIGLDRLGSRMVMRAAL